MTTESGPFDLNTTRLIVAPDLIATPKTVTPTFYEELDQEFKAFQGHTLISQFEFDEPWPTWEIHPEGDEFVYLISGDTDFDLWSEATGDQTVRVSEPGGYVVVPKGVWHTARPHKPTRMLFVTPGEGTLNEAWPPGRSR
jgi:mannose-6-phosphate isomerase-like protein (cupin superfamily)